MKGNTKQNIAASTMSVTLRFWALLTIVTCPVTGLAGGQVAQIDFKSQIQPILERACLECHGPVKQSNGFRLDTGRRSWRAGFLVR